MILADGTRSTTLVTRKLAARCRSAARGLASAPAYSRRAVSITFRSATVNCVIFAPSLAKAILALGTPVGKNTRLPT